MTLLLIVAFSSALALAGVILLLRPSSGFRTLDDLSSQLRSLNVDAFLNLVDSAEEAYLQDHLPPRVFRRIHRERMLAAMQYAWQAAQNATLLMRLAEMAQRESDLRVAQAAESLYKEALTLRICSLKMLPRLTLEAAMPSRGKLPSAFAPTYEAMSCKFHTLARLQQPGSLSRAA